MSRLPILRAVVLAAPLLFASGCASLGGNVKGSFACRAPEGTCAPTSAIDAGATGIEKFDTSDAHRTVTLTGEAVRRLQVVLTSYRDAAGRDHEARVVHLTLHEQAGAGWRAPQGRREVLRSLASTIAATREGRATRTNASSRQSTRQRAGIWPTSASSSCRASSPHFP